MGVILDILQSAADEHRKQTDQRTQMIINNFNYYNSLPYDAKKRVYEEVYKKKD